MKKISYLVAIVLLLTLCLNVHATIKLGDINVNDSTQCTLDDTTGERVCKLYLTTTEETDEVTSVRIKFTGGSKVTSIKCDGGTSVFTATDTKGTGSTTCTFTASTKQTGASIYVGDLVTVIDAETLLIEPDSKDCAVTAELLSNPKTGSSIPFVIIGLLGLGAGALYINSSKKNAFYKI